jgi:purine-nucleoside phosphorylase
MRQAAQSFGGLQYHGVSLPSCGKTIHELTRNGTNIIRVGSCDFVDRSL